MSPEGLRKVIHELILSFAVLVESVKMIPWRVTTDDCFMRQIFVYYLITAVHVINLNKASFDNVIYNLGFGQAALTLNPD